MAETLRQLYHQNGQPINGAGIEPKAARENGDLVGIARVYLWRKSQNGIEILVQKRSREKILMYGYEYEIAVGGHIDLGESQIDAAIRETREELGIKIDAENLHALSMFRLKIDKDEKTKIRNLVWAYSYRLNGDETFTPEEREIESTAWLSPDEVLNVAKLGKTAARPEVYENALCEIAKQNNAKEE